MEAGALCMLANCCVTEPPSYFRVRCLIWRLIESCAEAPVLISGPGVSGPGLPSSLKDKELVYGPLRG